MARMRQAVGTTWRRAAIAGIGVLALLVSACGDDTASNGAGGSAEGGDAPAEQRDSGSGSGSLMLDGVAYELTNFQCGRTVDGDEYRRGSGGPRQYTEIRIFEGSDYQHFDVVVRLPTEDGDVDEARAYEVWTGHRSTEAEAWANEVEVNGNRIQASLDLTQVFVDMEEVEDGPTATAEIDLTCPED